MQRAMAFGVLCCLTLGFTPLGCGGVDENARLARPVSEEGLKLPESTVGRLQECADEYAPRLGSPTYKLEYAVEAGAQGQVLKVETTDMAPFNRDVATCMMLALRAMTVPVSELRARSGPGVSKNTLTPAARGQVGFVFIPVAVAGLAEIVLVSGAVTFLLAISVSLVGAVAKDIEDVIDEDKETKRYCKEQQDKCLDTFAQSLPGSVNGSSLCLWCYDKCVADGSAWPSRVRGVDGRWLPCK